jgi:two-component sensor histidine kinase
VLRDKAERFCGCHRAFWPNGKPVAPSHSPMAEMLRTGRPVRDRELVVERPDGSRVTLLANLNPLLDGHGRIAGGVNCFQDITGRKEAEEHKMLLLRELAHRVNNTLAVILAIMQQSLRAAPSPESFAEAFTGRLQALAEAHRLLLASGWTGADLGQLARVELEAFAAPGDERVSLEGPPVRLGPTLVIALGIVLHELVVNASKHGALSNEAGRVALAWEVAGGSADRLRLCWAERGGPQVVSPSRKGLGSRLIERGLPGAAINWRFEPGGITCLIDLPLGAAADEVPLPRGLSRARAAS